MFVVVETTDYGETTMRQISDCLPAWLIDELAARGQNDGQNFNEVGGSPLGRAIDEPPMRSASEGSGARAIGVKGRGAKPRQVQNRGWVKPREGGDTRQVMAPTLVLVWVNEGMRGVYRRPYGASPASAPRSPLLTVVAHSTTSGVF